MFVVEGFFAGTRDHHDKTSPRAAGHHRSGSSAAEQGRAGCSEGVRHAENPARKHRVGHAGRNVYGLVGTSAGIVKLLCGDLDLTVAIKRQRAARAPRPVRTARGVYAQIAEIPRALERTIAGKLRRGGAGAKEYDGHEDCGPVRTILQHDSMILEPAAWPEPRQVSEITAVFAAMYLKFQRSRTDKTNSTECLMVCFITYEASLWSYYPGRP